MRFFLSRRWILFAITVALLAYGASLLGNWQFHRPHNRKADNRLTAKNLTAAPLPIDDVMRVLLWLWKTPAVSGLFNVGTGEARSFKDMMLAAYAALGTTPAIDYIDMPVAIRDSYQYFTQSDGERLRRAGYNGGFTSLEESVAAYVHGYLSTTDRYR